MAKKEAGLKPVLIVLCGPSHVGKTTFAQRLVGIGNNFEIISPDQIRKQLSSGFQDSRHESGVWDIYESMKCKALRSGCDVILDACHITRRARWHALQGPNSRHRKICVVFDLPLRTIRERCLKAGRVPLKEVERMWKAFQDSKPARQELMLQGFDDVYYVKRYSNVRLWHRLQHLAENRHTETGRDSRSILEAGQPAIMLHYLQTGLMARPGGRWYSNKEVNYGQRSACPAEGHTQRQEVGT
jgi:predicted kinase